MGTQTEKPADEYKTILTDFFAAEKQIQYSKNEIIVSAGETPPYVYYIVDGLIRVYALNEIGETNTHILYGRGEIFPLAWVIHRLPRDVYYEALSDCTLMAVSDAKLQAALENDPRITLAFLTQTIDQFRLYGDRINNLGRKFARERLAYRLLHLAGRFGQKEADGIRMPASLSQQIIGSSVNLSRESVGREIERLVRLGVARYDGKQLIIIDPIALSKEVKHVENNSWWVRAYGSPA